MPIDILLVEDNEGDIRLLRRLLLEANPGAQLHVVPDGEEAMQFLKYKARHSNAPRPDLILLDLKLPKMQGHEVLSRIKADPYLQTIPVIVLTSSVTESDLVISYQKSANCFLRKPSDLQEFEALVKSLNEFWLLRVPLPAKGQAMGPL
jgi:two-component system, chemotaxis family, response regulator Rcp1